MQEPFDITIGSVEYSVFPGEGQSYTIFKEGVEYMTIQKDTEGVWLKLDEETELPLFDENAEVNEIGKAINLYLGEEAEN